MWYEADREIRRTHARDREADAVERDRAFLHDVAQDARTRSHRQENGVALLLHGGDRACAVDMSADDVTAQAAL